MKTTVVQDSHGCIHIWKGFHIPNWHPTLPTVKGIEADLFIQSCTAIDGLRPYLNDKQIKELQNGYAIHTHNLPTEYFNN